VLGAGLAGAVLLQVAVRVLVTPHADIWSLVTIDADGAAVWASLTVADTGLLDDQLTTRVVVIPANGSLVEHRAQWGPTAVGSDGIQGSDSLTPEAGSWTLRVGGDGLRARLTLRDGAPGCPPTVGPVGGMVEDRTDGRLVDGQGLVVRERLVGHPSGVALYAVGVGFALGIDPWSECPAWVTEGDHVWTGDAVAIPDERRSSLEIGEWSISLRGLGDPVEHDEWAHALDPERWAAGLFGFPAPVTELRRVVLSVSGPGGARIVPGLRIERR
jgi:hypothetical protein